MREPVWVANAQLSTAMETMSMREGKFLEGKIAIVTGGGRGIGKVIARRLGKLGAATVVAGTTASYLEQVAQEIVDAGGKAKAIRCDVKEEADVLRLFDEAAEFGPVDVLINNAGIGRFGKLVDTSVADWDLVQAVNLRGAFLCGRQALRVMAGRGGRIINIASVVGIKGYADQGAYSASKFGLMGLSQVMAVEGQKDGVITQVIAPGSTDTELIAAARPDLDRSQTMDPEEIADAVEFLLGQTGSAVTDLVRLRRTANSPW